MFLKICFFIINKIIISLNKILILLINNLKYIKYKIIETILM